jgi:hypothetical protein
MRSAIALCLFTLTAPFLAQAQVDNRPTSIQVTCTLADETLECPACNVRRNDLEIPRGGHVNVFNYKGVAYFAAFGEGTPTLRMKAVKMNSKKVLVDVFSFFKKISTDPDVLPPEFRAQTEKNISFYCGIRIRP